VSTPTVTEIVTRPEPVARDPFIDDLRVAQGSGHVAGAEEIAAVGRGRGLAPAA
jgi:hypothetical protein